MKYETGFKKSIVRKMLLPDSPGITKISEEYGISAPTLYKWLKKYKESMEMANYKRSPEEWSLIEKHQALLETTGLGEQKLGEWLRRNGLHSEHLKLWPREIEKALLSVTLKEPEQRLREAQKTIKELKKEVRHKEKALAEVTAILALKKKL